jgi:hypothetical protein
MKLKSFLFLAAALAMGLAFASCGGDTEQLPGSIIKQGYASDAEAIEAAFNVPGVNEVWLTKETSLAGAILSIPANKTLHVNGKKVNVDGDTVIVAEGTLDLNDTGSVIYTTADTATLIGVTAPATQEAQEAHYSNNGAAGTAGILFHQGGGAGAASGGKYIIAGNAGEVLTGGSLAATGDGTIGIVIGAVSNDNAAYDIQGGGSLVVTGNMSLGTGYVQTYGLLEVKGALSGGTLNSASEVIRGGSQVTARSATIKGGSISNPFVVKSASTFGAASGGTLVTFGAELSAPEGILVTFSSPAKFDAAPATTLKAKFEDDVEFNATSITIADAEFGGNVTSAIEQTTATAARFTGNSSTLTGYLSANSVTLSGPLTIESGSLATGAAITVSSSNYIVLGADGGIEATGTGLLTGGTGYNVTGAGSLLNDSTTNGGTTITFGTGITKGAGSGTASIVFGGAVNLVYTGDAVISDLNLDVTGGGTVTLSGEGKTLILNGGSITTGAEETNIAYGGTIAGSAGAGGSLLVGTLANDGDTYIDTGTIAAGSIGVSETVGNFIVASSVFFPTNADVTTGLAGAVANAEEIDGGSAAAGGSILIFGRVIN